MSLPDPREQGSGNPGATNVLRIAGKKAAGVVFAGDALKGLIPVLIAKFMGLHGAALAGVALATVLGHIFPIFFGFKGGKGVATACGALFGLSSLLGILLVVTWILVAFITRLSSLAALVAAILAPIFCLVIGSASYFFPVLVMSILLIWRHADNIARLRARTESKIRF